MTRTEVIYLMVLILFGGTVFYFYDQHMAGDPIEEPEFEEIGNESVEPGGRVTEDFVSNDGEESRENRDLFAILPGFYREIDQKSRRETKNILLITADLSLYRLLMTQVKYAREYEGILGGSALKVRSDGSFIYDTIEGRPITEEQWQAHSQLDSVKKMNLLCVRLLKELNKSGIELSLRLDREKPEFSDKQMRLLRLLISDPQKLVTYMQERGFETIWINDYLNERLYNLGGYLVVPSSLKEEPETIFNALADGSYLLDSMD